VVVYFGTATNRRSRGASWSIIAPPFIRVPLRKSIAHGTRANYHVIAGSLELDRDLIAVISGVRQSAVGKALHRRIASTTKDLATLAVVSGSIALATTRKRNCDFVSGSVFDEDFCRPAG
jgi:hypothetical protein